ncbi:MAG: hypothetical protein MJ233_03430 [Mycoplasmoidaceae bacterium]|nr:hypothetical protein [Mycoplasmoidaceae bacterium]
MPSIFEYFSIDGIKRSTQGIKTYFISGNAENEAPQYSYYQDKFNNACPEDKAILKQFYRYPIVVDSQRIIRPVSY